MTWKDEVWKRQTVPDGPNGWIQWKGTDVCMDVHCVCGAHGHVDTGFAYYLLCTGCGRAYMTNGHVELLELTTDERAHLLNGDAHEHVIHEFSDLT